MQVTVVRPGDLGPSEADLWAKFQQSSPVMSSPFLSLTFAQAVGRFRPAARVAVIEDDGKIEAFLPFELASRKVAVPIGDPMNELQGFIGSGAPIDARAVVRKAGLRGWRFLHAPAEQESLLPHSYDGTRVQCPTIDLADGYKSYLSSRHKHSTKRIAEKRRSLARRLGEVSLEWNSCRPEDLRQIIEWKASKYGGARRLFADRTAVSITEVLATSDNEACQGVISVLSAGERPVAGNIGLMGPWGLIGWVLSYDVTLSRFSPGTIMLFALVEEAANRGIARIDFGGGQDSYKFSLANASYAVVGGAVWASRWEQSARSLYRRLHAAADRAPRTHS
jgi:CelD/BcsL family acetyltransferase involved in cellulose biosynthesis